MDIDMIAPGLERIVGPDPPLDRVAQGIIFGEGPSIRSVSLLPPFQAKESEITLKLCPSREKETLPSLSFLFGGARTYLVSNSP